MKTFDSRYDMSDQGLCKSIFRSRSGFKMVHNLEVRQCPSMPRFVPRRIQLSGHRVRMKNLVYVLLFVEQMSNTHITTADC